MDIYRAPDEPGNFLGTVVDAQNNLGYSSQLSPNEFRVALGMAAAAELNAKAPLPFPGEEGNTSIERPDSKLGQAARAAVFWVAADAKNMKVENITGMIMANMKHQCNAQQVLHAASYPEYLKTLPEPLKIVTEHIRRNPGEIPAMQQQASGDFDQLPLDRQKRLMDFAISSSEKFMNSSQNFANALENVVDDHKKDKANFTPAVYARAAFEGRLNEDLTITPKEGEKVQSVYLQDEPQRATPANQAAAMAAMGGFGR